MDEFFTDQFELAIILEGLRFLSFNSSIKEWEDFESMYCAKDL